MKHILVNVRLCWRENQTKLGRRGKKIFRFFFVRFLSSVELLPRARRSHPSKKKFIFYSMLHGKSVLCCCIVWCQGKRENMNLGWGPDTTQNFPLDVSDAAGFSNRGSMNLSFRTYAEQCHPPKNFEFRMLIAHTTIVWRAPQNIARFTYIMGFSEKRKVSEIVITFLWLFFC